MLARAHRLRSAKDIAKVYRRGVYGAGGGNLSVKAMPSGRAQSRAVVVVGKKVNKRAVVRNRIRRRLIEIIRSNLATVRPSYDIVMTVHTDIHDHSPTQLKANIHQAFAKAGLSANI